MATKYLVPAVGNYKAKEMTSLKSAKVEADLRAKGERTTVTVTTKATSKVAYTATGPAPIGQPEPVEETEAPEQTEETAPVAAEDELAPVEETEAADADVAEETEQAAPVSVEVEVIETGLGDPKAHLAGCERIAPDKASKSARSATFTAACRDDVIRGAYEEMIGGGELTLEDCREGIDWHSCLNGLPQTSEEPITIETETTADEETPKGVMGEIPTGTMDWTRADLHPPVLVDGVGEVAPAEEDTAAVEEPEQVTDVDGERPTLAPCGCKVEAIIETGEHKGCAKAAADQKQTSEVTSARPRPGRKTAGGTRGGRREALGPAAVDGWDLLYDKPRHRAQIGRKEGAKDGGRYTLYALICVTHKHVHPLAKLSDDRALLRDGGWCPECTSR